jgi:hypothetical protein
VTEHQGLGDVRLLASAERLLADAEQRIRLLDRVRPRNFGVERTRLSQKLSAGERAEPSFEYDAANDLHDLCLELEVAARGLTGAGPLGELYAARAEELLLEARLAESIGTPALRTLAEQRYPASPSEELDALLAAFDAAKVDEPSQLIRASDASDPRSLLSVLRARVSALDVPVRIDVRPHLHSVAAAGEGFVALRADALLSARAAERIACHELYAHVLPRMAAGREAFGIYRVGTRGANEDEEGRALCIEERMGFLDGARKQELFSRHRLAVAVRQGADFEELVASVTERGLSPTDSLDFSLRALRGGGLSREVVYLPAYLRVARAFEAEPRSERFFERGRVAVAALPVLRSLDLNR